MYKQNEHVLKKRLYSILLQLTDN